MCLIAKLVSPNEVGIFGSYFPLVMLIFHYGARVYKIYTCRRRTAGRTLPKLFICDMSFGTGQRTRVPNSLSSVPTAFEL